MDNKYLAAFQYVGSRISDCKIKNGFLVIDNTKELKRSIDVSHRIQSIDIVENETVISGVIEVNIKVTLSSGKQRYSISLSIEGCFEAPAEMGEEDFRTMLQVNGITSLYSIARGFVQSTTSQTLLSGNVLLPMFNVAAYSKDLNNNQTEE